MSNSVDIDRRNINTSSSLIVDWPKGEDELPSSKSSTRQVSFSPTRQLIIIPQGSTETMFYSQDDVDIFRHNLRHDIQQMRRRFASSKVISKEEIHDYVGLEQFTSKEVHQHIMLARRVHIQSVLRVQGQQRLKGDGVVDSHVIAMASMVTSRWARQRAEKIALCYARLDKVAHAEC